ncbi:DUF2274 domain-containing protein [Rhodanobacter ginsengisoli]|uniref:DUF2274 domain-containing protein n=1 Tax=Rhodanobacter ginsengisoli TaxID=418646 RepID=A0ABW0QPZ5_9GAMM
MQFVVGPTSTATRYARVYGEAVDATTLISHMLDAFMARDRASNGWRGNRGTGLFRGAG